jgi:hypothetical protein
MGICKYYCVGRRRKENEEKSKLKSCVGFSKTGGEMEEFL